MKKFCRDNTWFELSGTQVAPSKGISIQLENFYLWADHNYFGHHGRASSNHPSVAVTELNCVTGRGIVGDRFFDYRPDYAGQITFFSGEVFDERRRLFNLPNATPAATRRNVVVRGFDLPALADREFWLQGIWFRGAGECKPCYWMNTALAPESGFWLGGRGGLRARILTDGILRLGPAQLVVGAGSTDACGVGLDRFPTRLSF